MVRLEGLFHLPRQSKALSAWVNCLEDGQLYFVCPEANIDTVYKKEEYQLGDYLPSLPLTVRFPDDSIFTPHPEQQEAFKEWSKPFRQGKMVEWFEYSLKALVVAVVLIPLIIIGFYTWGVPVLAHGSAELIPYALQKQVGDETLVILEKAYLSDTQLPIETQQSIERNWRASLQTLNVDNRDSFTLLFRQSTTFQNNAFALTNRTIVITDSLIKKLDQDQDQILSILLHETGHVIHQHGVKKLLESAYVASFTTILLGDVQTLGDVFVSVGSGIINNAFSRDMEREADQFAIQGLKTLNKTSIVFAKAMENLTGHHSDHSEHAWYEDIFSTHPNTQERIDAAK